MTEINDCPFCRQPDAEVEEFKPFYVTCVWCGAQGPFDKDQEVAIKGWNAVTDDIDGLTFNERSLRNECERLRRELDEVEGVIR